jgi:tRNA/rRNA methyltransferase
MAQIRVILVNPEYQQNIGYCARVMRNFGFGDLWIIGGPKIGQEAVKYSKHAANLLKSARTVKKLEDAVEDCSMVVGTTAIEAAGRNILRNSITPKQLAEQIARSYAKVALLMGSEGRGLNADALEACDIIVRIPASQEYGTLNISHALAILLYELSGSGTAKEKTGERPKGGDSVDPKDRQFLIGSIDRLVSGMHGLKNPKTVRLTVRRAIFRGIRSPIEGRALIQFLKKIKPK